MGALRLLGFLFLIIVYQSNGFSGPRPLMDGVRSMFVAQKVATLPPPSPLGGCVGTKRRVNTVLYAKKKGVQVKKERTRRPRDADDDSIEVEATVLEGLPNGMFRCEIIDAPESQAPVVASISGKIRKNFVKIVVGDQVTIQLSPYDLKRGRIVFRKR